MRLFHVVVCFLCTMSVSAQNPDAIRYLIANCDDSLIIAGVAAHKPDTNHYGDSPILRLKDLKTGKLYLYPAEKSGYNYLTFEKIPFFSGTTVIYCLTDAQTDSLLQCSEFMYRLPIRKSLSNFDQEKINEISKKYGVVIEWSFFHLVDEYEFYRSDYIKMVKQILERRNGPGWEDCFWRELLTCNDTSKYMAFNAEKHVFYQ